MEQSPFLCATCSDSVFFQVTAQGSPFLCLILLTLPTVSSLPQANLCVRACVYVFVCACVRACVRACVCVCVLKGNRFCLFVLFLMQECEFGNLSVAQRFNFFLKHFYTPANFYQNIISDDKLEIT